MSRNIAWLSLCIKKGPGKRGHIVADTLLPMMFLGLRNLGNICCGHKMFLNKIRNIFCVPDTKFVSATNVARAGKRGNICVGNNVSSFARVLMSSSLWNNTSLVLLFFQLIDQEVTESQLKGQLESATQQAEQYKVISFVVLMRFLRLF